MGLSCRRYFIDNAEGVIRIRNTTFDGLLRDPDLHRMPSAAGQRVRVAELLVEVSGRTVLRIVRRVYFVLTFDEDGRVDIDRFQRQLWALAGVAIDVVFANLRRPSAVLDAADRFVAQGRRWHPTHALAQRIDEVALSS
jgi:hypothetical protein